MKQVYLFKRLFASFILLLATSFSWAYDFEVNGICYNKNSDGTSVTVTDKSYKNGYSGSVTIPATVTYNSKNYNVTSIGNYAFQWCEYLTSVFIPYGVTSIGDDAFIGCSKLTTVTIPYSLTTIGMTAFHDCSSLTSIYIPSFVFSIKVAAFSGCTKLTSITVDEGNFKYDSRNNCNAIIERETNKLISGCKNTVIPDGVTSIGEHAYYDCFDLASTTIPNSVTSIEQDAFHGCSSLTSVTCLAEEVPSTGNNVFYNVPQSTATLYVPAGSVDAYKAAAQWKEFGQILPIEDGPTIIDFADANVKQLCVANWDTSGDGELDEDEAAAVTSLGEVFKDNTTITSFDELQYFTGLTEISDNAFRSCSNLTTVTIPNSVTSIGDNAFYYCFGLTSISVPESVYYIGDHAFRSCSSLTRADFASIESLCSISFMDHDSNPLCYAHHLYIDGQEVTGVVIPNSVTSINYYTFYNCFNLASVTIPNSVTSIRQGAFQGCSSLSSVEIPESVTSIGIAAFSGCPGLTSITIPESVTSIGESAFRNCSGLTSVTIPESVTNIDVYVFAGCTNLINITVADGNTKYDSRNNCNAIIETSTNKLISGCRNTVIPNSVTSIGLGAFLDCSSLTSVTIGNSVTRIDSWAFSDCSGLTSITCLAENVPYTGSNAFGHVPQSTATLYVPAGSVDAYKAAAQWKEFGQILPIEDGPTIIDFADANVKQLCVANWDTNGDGELDEDEAAAVTSLGEVFKENTSITSFDELQYFTGLTTIGDYAFYYCFGLTSITIPNSVTSIGDNTFSHCFGLTSITIPNSVTSIGDYAFSWCFGLTSITIPESVTSIGTFAFESCSGLTSITIPNSVTSIGDHAFYNCSGLTSIKIPESVTSIGDDAFERCTSLPMIDNIRYADTYLVGAVDKTQSTYNIKAGTRFIGSSAFRNRSGLTSVTIPNSVTSIGNYAFDYCSGLTSITIPESVTSIGDYAFRDCSGLTSVTIPNSVTSIGAWAFSCCSGLTSITIPNSVTSIGQSAFDDCSGLTSVTCLAEEVPGTGGSAFSDVPQSTATLYVPAGSVDAYKAAKQWKKFGNIVGIDPTAVEELKSKKTLKANESAPIYDLMGRRLTEKPASGYYIQGGKKYFVK